MSFSVISAKIKQWNRQRIARRRAIKKHLTDERRRLAAYGKSPIEINIGKRPPRKFHFRPDSRGDRSAIEQIFVDMDYDMTQWEQGLALLSLAEKIEARGSEALVVDAGANIGAAAAFFQQVVPAAKLVCVEPSPANCRVCRENLAGTGAVLLESAIGSSVGSVKLVDPGKGDLGFRTGDVLASAQHEQAVVPCITMPKILEDYGNGIEPLIAKIDIEGAEADLFSGNCEWMDAFPCIIIELHDWMLPRERTSANFIRQVSARNFDFIYRGENVFLFNMRLIDEKTAFYS